MNGELSAAAWFRTTRRQSSGRRRRRLGSRGFTWMSPGRTARQLEILCINGSRSPTGTGAGAGPPAARATAAGLLAAGRRQVRHRIPPGRNGDRARSRRPAARVGTPGGPGRAHRGRWRATTPPATSSGRCRTRCWPAISMPAASSTISTLPRYRSPARRAVGGLADAGRHPACRDGCRVPGHRGAEWRERLPRHPRRRGVALRDRPGGPRGLRRAARRAGASWRARDDDVPRHPACWRRAARFFHAEALPAWRKRTHLPARARGRGRGESPGPRRRPQHVLPPHRGPGYALRSWNRSVEARWTISSPTPEDYAQQRVEWVDGQFGHRPHHPAFEVIYVYSQRDGTLDVNIRGARTAVEPLQGLFAATILKQPRAAPRSDRRPGLRPERVTGARVRVCL